MRTRIVEVQKKSAALLLALLLAMTMGFGLIGCKKDEPAPTTDAPATTAPAGEEAKAEEPVYSNTVETVVEPADDAVAGDKAAE